MRIRVFIGTVFLLITYAAYPQKAYVIDWDFTGQSFEAFARETESRYPVKFFYIDEWINDITLHSYEGKKMLKEILDTIFKGRSIYYYATESGNIILTKQFAIKTKTERQVAKQIFIPGIENSEEKETEPALGNIMVDIGNPAEKNNPGYVSLSGYIKDQDTKQPVAGVTVYIPKLSSGTLTNEYGFYKLSLPRGTFSLRFTFIGMKERVYDLNIYGPGELNVEMKTVLVPLKGAVITAEKDITLQRTETGVEKINITTFRLQPTTMGEPDIVKSILQVPGVNTVGEGSTGYNVRGGSADQNLILLYGAPVYNSSHMFGFFSAINSDIISDVTLYKGGIPGRYGGRLSSVMDITPREGNRTDFAGNAGISPITAHFVAEGPLKKDTLFYILAGRASYSDWILKIIDDPSLNNSQASFYDLNGRLAWDINRKNKIDFSGYYSHDRFRLNSDSTYKYQNNIFALRWRHFFSSRFFSSLIINNSLYRYDISSHRVPREAFNLSHRLNSTGIKADFNWFAGRNDFNFGTDIIRYNVQPGNYMPADDSSIVIPSSIERQSAVETAIYFEDKLILTDFLTLNAGLRYSSFFATGPQTVLIYDPDYPVSLSSVVDTASFGTSSIYKTYSGPELRISANLRISKNSSLKLNYNHTIQYLHLLSNTAAVSPSDTWKISDYHIEPQAGDQFGAGFYWLFNNKIEASAEIYYKKIDNMIDFKGGTDLIMNENIERDLINVYGKAYGLELLIAKPEGRIRWNVAYTYSRVLLRSKGSFKEEMINSGNWFPANFDRPHDLILAFYYLHSRRVSISANYNYSSGRPVTYPVSSYNIGDIVLTHYSERNKYRIPDYSRLDLAVKISGSLKSKKIANPHWIFSIYNATGRNNVYSAYFKNVKNSVRGYYLSVFDRPIPSISFNFDF